MRPTSNGLSVPPTLSSNDYESLPLSRNDTQDTEARLLEGPLSSTIALIVLCALIVTVIMTSLVTYCFHKWELRGKKLQRAQEEYQKDQEKNSLQGTS